MNVLPEANCGGLLLCGYYVVVDGLYDCVYQLSLLSLHWLSSYIHKKDSIIMYGLIRLYYICHNVIKTEVTSMTLHIWQIYHCAN